MAAIGKRHFLTPFFEAMYEIKDQNVLNGVFYLYGKQLRPPSIICKLVKLLWLLLLYFLGGLIIFMLVRYQGGNEMYCSLHMEFIQENIVEYLGID